MKRISIAAGLAAITLSGTILTVHATSAVSGSFTDKPYTATNPDSGSCGQNWAIDLFSRDFVVSPKATDGTTKVVEHFQNAKFITLGDGETGSSRSPGACDSGGNSTHTLAEGITGTFTGTFTIIVNAGFTYDSGQGCSSDEGASGAAVDDGCNDATWVENAFPGAVFNTDTTTSAYSLTYKATGSGLSGKTWTDSSAGDSGDIYTGS